MTRHEWLAASQKVGDVPYEVAVLFEGFEFFLFNERFGNERGVVLGGSALWQCRRF